MRLRAKAGIVRALYLAATGRRLAVVRVFVEKTQAAARREVDLALRRAAEIER